MLYEVRHRNLVQSISAQSDASRIVSSCHRFCGYPILRPALRITVSKVVDIVGESIHEFVIPYVGFLPLTYSPSAGLSEPFL